MLPATFQTFSPLDAAVAKHVDYYYLERKPENTVTTFECFPHYNNTLSLYAAHRMTGVGQIVHDPAAPPAQIFTPVRDAVLRVRQTGPVHRVVIVFHALGIQHFWRNVDFATYQVNYPFFTDRELSKILETDDTQLLLSYLDGFLKSRYVPRPPDLVTSIINYLFDHPVHFSVAEMARDLGVSRRHLLRVFRTTIGVSLKRFHQIIVLRSVMDRRLAGSDGNNLTQLAYAANFSDQAHMIKLFRGLTRNAPRQFFARGEQPGNADLFWHRLR